MEMSKLFDGGSKPFSPSRVSFETMRPHVIYRRYTGGIRAVYGWYTVVYGGYTQYIVSIAYIGYKEIYGDIRGYTQYKASIAYIGYTGMYGDIRVVHAGYWCQL